MKEFFKHNSISMAVMAAASVLRIWLGELLGLWIPLTEVYDDLLLVKYADFPSYFAGLAVPTNDIMLKELGFPVILHAVDRIRIPYTLILSVLWIAAALLMVRLMCFLTKKRTALTAVFVFVLFSPVAFDIWTGTRIYRNAILTPLYFIVFTLALILITGEASGEKAGVAKTAIRLTALGAVFTLTYYVKEDGIWVLACLLFLLAVYILLYAYQNRRRKKRLLRLLLLILPVIIFAGCTVKYKSVNGKYFGVYETNLRTSGGIGGFVSRLYQIASDDRTVDVWAPPDTFEKAFAASPTMRGHQELYDAVMHSLWADGDLRKNPVNGDFMTWIMKDALYDAGIAASPSEAEAFFRTVNEELDAAFESGTLQKDSRISLLSSTGGVTTDEAMELLSKTWDVYYCHLVLDTFEPGGSVQQDDGSGLAERTSETVNVDLLPDGEAARLRKAQIEGANRAVDILFGIYRVVYPVLFFLALAGTVLFLVQMARRGIRRMTAAGRAAAFLALFNLLVSFAYAFFIERFSHFIVFTGRENVVLKFYGIGMVPLLEIFMAAGLFLFVINAKKSLLNFVRSDKIYP